MAETLLLGIDQWFSLVKEKRLVYLMVARLPSYNWSYFGVRPELCKKSCILRSHKQKVTPRATGSSLSPSARLARTGQRSYSLASQYGKSAKSYKYLRCLASRGVGERSTIEVPGF